jgi:large subunit ribosomal protein L2
MNKKIKYLNSYKKPSFLSKKPFDFSLTKSLKKNGGRNNQGRITVRHRGGGHKKRLRLLDFNFKNLNGIVESIEYDPTRSSFIAGCKNPVTGKNFYTLLTEGLSLKSQFGLKSKEDPVFKIGNSAKIVDYPLGSLLHSVELKPKKGSQIARSAGSYIKLIQKDLVKGIARVKLPSKKEISLPLNSLAIYGIVSNASHRTKDLSKAGRSRWLGKKPTVRGVAMNPIDHPHGGGEGKSSGGRPSVTPWGRLTRGQPTRKKNKQF